ncbi:MAG: ChbG/HpnK family deacetylase [Chloroflexi bacterium]|nr:ChbG/HpnK family deacetylase [Chloroflexota bacterium]
MHPHATNAAILRALTDGVVTSTTLMAPCPWALHAIRLLKEHPELPFGVHLTAICDGPDYRWGRSRPGTMCLAGG